MVNPIQRYPVQVDIIEQRAGSVMVKKGRAARIQKKNGFCYYEIKLGLLKKPIRTKPVRYEHLYVTKGGYKTYLYSPSPDQYIPLQLDVKKAEIKAIDEDLRLFLVDSIIDSNIRFKPLTWFHKYFPILSIVFTAVAIAIIMFASAEMLQTAGGTVSSAANILTSTQQMLTGTQVVG